MTSYHLATSQSVMFTLRHYFYYVIVVTEESLDKATSTKVSCKPWTPPSGWTGPSAALYRTFDSLDGLVLMEGIQQIGAVPPVSGKVLK